MGRHSRQQRRAQTRRQQHRLGGTQFAGMRGQFFLGIAIAVVAVAAFGFFALYKGSPSATASPTPQFPEGPRVGAVHCDQGASGYHVHAHLDIFRAGKREIIPAQSGSYTTHDCTYWMHSHDTSGVIHIEAAQKITPTLADWFTIIKLTKGAAPNIAPDSGQTMKVWLNEKPYAGDPLKLVLVRHEDIAIELGPPWVTPQKYGYPGGL
jgi:hypothetical protein